MDEAKKRALAHLQFCAAMYREQLKQGRYVLHEHPDTATSWRAPCIEELTELPQVNVARDDLCMFGLRSKDKIGEAPAKKAHTLHNQ